MPRKAAEHGSTSMYVYHKCRCERCREAWRSYVAGWRSRIVLTDDDSRHGTLNAYNNYRCRCDRCRAARAAYISPKYRKGPEKP